MNNDILILISEFLEDNGFSIARQNIIPPYVIRIPLHANMAYIRPAGGADLWLYKQVGPIHEIDLKNPNSFEFILNFLNDQ